MTTALPLARMASQIVVSTLQLASGLQSERDLVAHGAGDPAILGDAGDGREAHAGRAATHLENGRHRVDARNQRDIILQ